MTKVEIEMQFSKLIDRNSKQEYNYAQISNLSSAKLEDKSADDTEIFEAVLRLSSER